MATGAACVGAPDTSKMASIAAMGRKARLNIGLKFLLGIFSLAEEAGKGFTSFKLFGRRFKTK